MEETKVKWTAEYNPARIKSMEANMAQREWFTPEICEGLSKADCAVLNCAARHAFPVGKQPQHIELVVLRTEYKPGMSAKDLLKAAGYDE